MLRRYPITCLRHNNTITTGFPSKTLQGSGVMTPLANAGDPADATGDPGDWGNSPPMWWSCSSSSTPLALVTPMPPRTSRGVSVPPPPDPPVPWGVPA
eukprot:870040-Prorocentrum_minimum.AAC.1